MTPLTDIDGVDLASYARSSLTTPEVPLSFVQAAIDAESTRIPLTLAAVADDAVVAEYSLTLAFRLRVDDVLHLWSQDDASPLSATVMLDTSTRNMTVTLRFSPAGKSARLGAKAAAFLRSASNSDHIAVRLPDGTLSGDRIPLPPELRIDEGVKNLLDLIADVARLSGLDLVLPDEVPDDLLDALVVARALLNGQEVSGTWNEGELTMFPGAGLDALRAALLDQSRHELLMESPLTLDFVGTQVDLGEAQQLFSDAVVDSIDERSGMAVVHIRPYKGRGRSLVRPLRRRPGPLDPHLVFPRDVFEQMLSDAGDDEARLRELL